MSRALTALLSALILSLPLASLADLDKKKWRDAITEERAQVPKEISNLFFMFNESRNLVAYAGSAPVATEFLVSEESRKKFISEVLEGAQEAGGILKERRERTVNGHTVTECIFDAPQAGRMTLGLFCVTKDRMVSLSVVSLSGKIDWEDTDVKELVARVPIK
jgi:hypothetical protein